MSTKGLTCFTGQEQVSVLSQLLPIIVDEHNVLWRSVERLNDVRVALESQSHELDQCIDHGVLRWGVLHVLLERR